MATSVDINLLRTRFDLRDMAASYTTLRRHSSNELAGPCPRCGGEDRFYVSRDHFACRQCNPRGGDAIDFLRWLHGVDFKEALHMLDSSAAPALQRKATPIKAPEPSTWDGNAMLSKLVRMQQALHGAQSAGSDYLGERRLTMETARAYGLGLTEDALGKGPALAIPWFRSHVLTAIRYRFLHSVGKQKMISEPGSRFGGYLFGGQALPLSMDSMFLGQRSLLICEGEINAMSLYQVGKAMRVDVLSVGGEAAILPESLVNFAARYRARVVWFDKRERAQEHAKALDALAFWSEADGKKRDANDYLKAGNLTGLLGKLLERATKPEHAEALKWDLWDGGLS